MPEKLEKKIVPKPKLPSKREEPPPAKGTISPQRKPFILIALIGYLFPFILSTVTGSLNPTAEHFYMV